MGLNTYKQKRKFEETPEPEGMERSTGGKELHFVVQKHNATHLHYDFRLEIDGVLKSWAIPKGPSLNPRDKRLAMEVEDHPLEYRKFEGKIPEGNYGAGDVIIWDEGTYSTPGSGGKEESEKILREGYRSGSFDFVLHGKKLNGQFHLRKFNSGGKNTWLLIKAKDNFSSDEDITEQEASVVSGKSMPTLKNTRKGLLKPGQDKILKTELSNFSTSKMPHSAEPMLAELVEEPFNDRNWIFEVKWDGYRAIAEIEKSEVSLLSRGKNSFNEKYPEIVEALKGIKHDAVLDGEVVALDKTGKSNFQLLQNYSRTKEGELIYYVFDLLYLDGYDLRDLPLKDRKDMLRKLLPELRHVRFSDHVKESGIDFFMAAQEKQQEGIMAKDLRSPYRSGQRTGEWQKIKTHMRQEAVIAGFTEPRGTRKYLGALVLGMYDKNHELHYVGHAGGGFDRESLLEMRKRLDPLVQDDPPFARPPRTNMPVKWVRPELVCEVSFSEWTEKGIMRQPIFMGLREDKKPLEVKREEYMNKVTERKTRKPAVRKPQKENEEEITVSKGKLTLTNLDKVYWPDEGYTKRDLIDYYRNVLEYILPYLKDRPHTLLRHPNGIEGESFFQKDMGSNVPGWIKTVKIPSESTKKEVEYLVCTNEASLLYMVNLGCIEINPWFSRVRKLDKPDYMVIDLDPLEVSFDNVVETALAVREVIVDEAKAKCFCKTSGATGLHIYVPLNSKYNFEISKEFAHLIARVVHEKLPDTTSLERSPEKRKGKVYLDYLQNKTGATVAAPYSIRPRPGAPVSTPLDWEEVRRGLDPMEFTLKTVRKRLNKLGDIFLPALGQEINVVKCINNLEAAERLNK
ncbi:MAG: DNA ligase D [Ignavibacteria bacterium]|jgi:bifunctional non-homologous end joining protein LigD|nr:DNA ligase D [Ignavibacteria bacterium]MCU7502209.1 DNA ligase D [Ignavibacteria bacterium]MCU7517426.1 DNA ligase D [Ignavibacteria bacterium]